MLRRVLLKGALGMPFGTAVGQGFVNPVASSFSAGNVFLSKKGMLIYYPSPGTNNLIASDTPGNPASPGTPSFTDKYNNAVLPGEVTYAFSSVLSKYVAIQSFGQSIIFYTATSEAGPWTAGPNIALNSSGLLELNGETIVNGNFIVGAPTAGMTVDLVGNLVSMVGTLELTTAAVIKFGASLDTDLYRLAANSLATDGAFTVGHALTAIGGTPANPSLVTTDSWHSAAIGGAWAASGNGVNGFFYRLLSTGDVLLAWDVTNSSANPGTLTTLPAGYQPATTVRLQSGWAGTGPAAYNNSFNPTLSVSSAGAISGAGLFVSGLTLFGTAILPIGAL